MRTLIGAVALTVVAIAVTMPPALAQTAPKPDPASAGIPSCGCDAGDATRRGSGPGYGPYGPGMMMGGGPGMMAGGRGQGMMGGGPGPGMMGGGPGMMGSPGMMGGHGFGMMGSPGTMEGHGFGMIGAGSGMMGMRMYAALDLTDQQRAKIARILEDARKKNWDALGKVMEESATLRDLYNAPTHDPAAIGRQTVRIAELKRPIIESMVVARDQIDALLTTEQKDQLRSMGRGRMMFGG